MQIDPTLLICSDNQLCLTGRSYETSSVDTPP